MCVYEDLQTHDQRNPQSVELGNVCDGVFGDHPVEVTVLLQARKIIISTPRWSILIFGVERFLFQLSCQDLLLVCRASHLDNLYRASVWLALTANDLLSSCDFQIQIFLLFLIGDVVNSTMQCLVNQGHWIRHFVVVGWLSLHLYLSYLVPWILIRFRLCGPNNHLQLVGGLSLSPKGAEILLFLFLVSL